MRTGLRHDPINPLPPGRLRQGSLAPRRGLVRTGTRLPWIAPAAVWERLVLHVVTQETPRNRALILVAYDGALRREELVRLRADDYDRAQALLSREPHPDHTGITRARRTMAVQRPVESTADGAAAWLRAPGLARLIRWRPDVRTADDRPCPGPDPPPDRAGPPRGASR